MDIQALEKIALSIRALTIDAIQKANSGHPGLPLGASELGAFLYGELLNHDPDDPQWINRDRFILSAGHGSMLLYSLLYLSGYPLSLDDIKHFRQVGSPAAGHPEYGLVPGIEATTGPLGQGVAMAVGIAIAETMLAARFNTEKHQIIDHYTYALVGDGCLQEGVSSEASSLAGHLALGKLIVFYDSNNITIDGSTDLSFTEKVAARYLSYGWQVLHGSMYNFEKIAQLTTRAKAETGKPTLIILKSIIGKGSPHKQKTADAHGAPLGTEEASATKLALGIPDDFYVDPVAKDFFAGKRLVWKANREAWQKKFEQWGAENPEKHQEWNSFFNDSIVARSMPVFKVGDSVATRAAGNKALGALAAVNEQIVGGSADLRGPNAVGIACTAAFSATNRQGRYLHFGIREFAMAAISNGIVLHGGLRAFCATFMVFSDYLRPALRLSALMKQPVIYVLTHDSIFVGEDGPTHQPVEHLAALRVIPGLRVLRPADAEETIVAWEMALEWHDGPTVLALSRQGVPVFVKEDPDWHSTIRTGAYVVKKIKDPELVIIATGSEVNLALEAAALVPEKKVQVVSMISRELFEAQAKPIQEAIVPPGIRILCCEAGVRSGWEHYADREDILSIDRFGESGPAKKVAEHLGFTAAALAAMLRKPGKAHCC
ncbi:MAG: transketolase [Spirochaetaceae bacterium]|jgi:transketolase|nr:transketolase [Spirochaetaceae bacterium]